MIMYKIRLLAILTIFLLFCQSCLKNDDPFNPQTEYGSMNDIDGNTYRTVNIGEQVWMAENLRTTRYRDGSEIGLVADPGSWSAAAGSYCWYDNDRKSGKKGFGALYNWTAVQTKNLCPTGWHVPDIGEWNSLSDYLILNGFNFDGSLSENKSAKSLASDKYWEPEGETGSPCDDPETNNRTGFSAVPAGFRDPTHGWNAYNGMGYCCYWWTATEYGSFALHTGLSSSNPALFLDDPVHGVTSTWNYGFSVRCIKDK
jgi:uncharacterized protein (TIGR02145 family)